MDDIHLRPEGEAEVLCSCLECFCRQIRFAAMPI